MYKKITHNIVEEHFDHPMAAELKSTINGGPKSMSMNMLTRSASIFRDHTHRAFATLCSHLRGYIVSVIDGGADQEILLTYLISDINKISTAVKTYYGESAAATFEKLFTAVATSAFDVIKAVKAGQDPKDLKLKAATAIRELATFLDTANPYYWLAENVWPVLSKIVDSWVAQAEARVKKDWAIDIAAAEEAHALLVAGKPDGTPGFASVFADGIISQFPEKFNGY